MEQLNIHNYEAFYLDFLEGNLEEVDAVQLLRFLDENPSLKLEDENFDTIDNAIDQLDDSFKNDLKQVDFELDEVTQQTINTFLIAQFEKQLSSEKEKEIKDFLGQHPIFISAQQQIKSTFLFPDLSIVYPHKKELKKSEIRYLWPIISSVAAILVVLFLVMSPTSTSLNGDEKVAILPQKPLVKNEPILFSKEINAPIKTERKAKVKSIKSIPSNFFNDTSKTILAQIDSHFYKNEFIDNQDVAIQSVSVNSENNSSNSSVVVVSKTVFKSNEVFNCVSMLDKYPIESLTYNLSILIKKQVEFKTCKNSKSNKTGFYLKIGKFIISKQTT